MCVCTYTYKFMYTYQFLRYITCMRKRSDNGVSVNMCKYVYIQIYTHNMNICNYEHMNPDDGVSVCICKHVFVYTNVL